MHIKKWTPILTLTMLFMAMPNVVFATEQAEQLGDHLPVWSIIPFVGMLLSIAICPLVNGHWWEHNQGKVSAFWSLVFLIPFVIGFGMQETIYELYHSILLDYIPFIILLFGLFCVAGGIVLRGNLRGNPRINVIILAIGTVLASVIGTTGAAMLLIRPLIRANNWRKHRTHTIVFFIFLACNIGGALTPVGDPPLFMGFLRGVPFFWTTENVLMPYLFNSIILLLIYYFLDRYFYKKDLAAVDHRDIAGEDEGALRIEGAHNFVFILMILAGVILSGVLPKLPLFADQATGEVYGIHMYHLHGHDIVWEYTSMIRDVIILLAAFLSMKTTSKTSREYNRFNWGPIEEVAKLFIGIFITMIPALAILGAKGASLGIEHPAQFFWASGLLSSFLDNTPTYVVFLTTAGALHVAGDGIQTTVGLVHTHVLEAISAGAVFMGAMTYIGNAPNFMVRSIAEENHVKMPSFFGYMGWSIAFLIPLFILDTLIFFLPYAQ